MKIANSSSEFRRLFACMRWVSWAILVMMVVVWIVGIVVVATEDSANTTFSTGFKKVAGNEMTVGDRVFTAAGVTVMVALLTTFLWMCTRLFRRYEQGAFFDQEITKIYRWLSRLALCAWLTSVVLPLGGLVLLAFAGAKGTDVVPIEFNFGYLFGAIWLSLISRVMAEGERLQNEASLTI